MKLFKSINAIGTVITAYEVGKFVYKHREKIQEVAEQGVTKLKNAIEAHKVKHARPDATDMAFETGDEQ